MVGKILCFFGRHKWEVIGETWIERISKWQMFEVANGECVRCDTTAEIRRDYYW